MESSIRLGLPAGLSLRIVRLLRPDRRAVLVPVARMRRLSSSWVLSHWRSEALAWSWLIQTRAR